MLQFAIYRIAQAIALLLPLRAGYLLASLLAKMQFYISARDRETVISNLKVVLKEDGAALRRISKEAFINFAKYLVDFFRFSKLDIKYIEDNVKIVGRENLDEALRRGRGVITLTAHLGNYELGGAVLSLLGYATNVVALPHKNKFVNKFFVKQRQIARINVIPMGSALKKCYECLGMGEALALLGDRDFSNRGIALKFFGMDSLIPKGPAVLSLRTGALIVPGFIVRLPDDKFQFSFERPIEISPSGNFDGDVRRITQSCTRVIEEYVRKYPSQWFMFRTFWA